MKSKKINFPHSRQVLDQVCEVIGSNASTLSARNSNEVLLERNAAGNNIDKEADASLCEIKTGIEFKSEPDSIQPMIHVTEFCSPK